MSSVFKDEFRDKVKEHSKNIWLPRTNNYRTSIDTDSWYYHQETYYKDNLFPKIKLDISDQETYIKCMKYELKPNTIQKNILLRWFDCYIRMYNESLRVIKKVFFEKNNKILNSIRRKHNKNYRKINFQRAMLKKFKKKIKNISDKIKNNKKKMKDIKNIKQKEKIANIICNMESNIKNIRLRKIEYEKNYKNNYNDFLENRRSYMNMLNEHYNKIKDICNFKNLRTKYMKPIKKSIQEESIIDDNQNTKIPSHILDGAIQDVCASYKSAITNLKRGHIRHFCIRYIKKDKCKKVIKIEKCYFSKQFNTFCLRALGDSIHIKKLNKKKDKDFDMRTIDTDCRILYDSRIDRFLLLVPKHKQISKCSNQNICCNDLGVRTFITGMNNGGIVYEIGTNVIKKLERLHKSINNLRKNNSSRKKIGRKEHKKRVKIENLVDDLHWKSIKYLTDNHGNIVIGKLSTRSILRQQMNPLMKNIIQSLSFYKFLTRLKYKCLSKNINLHIVNEYYTSMTCTNCGWCKKKSDSSKRFYCKKCKLSIDRDINGARNILIKCL